MPVFHTSSRCSTDAPDNFVQYVELSGSVRVHLFSILVYILLAMLVVVTTAFEWEILPRIYFKALVNMFGPPKRILGAKPNNLAGSLQFGHLLPEPRHELLCVSKIQQVAHCGREIKGLEVLEERGISRGRGVWEVALLQR